MESSIATDAVEITSMESFSTKRDDTEQRAAKQSQIEQSQVETQVVAGQADSAARPRFATYPLAAQDALAMETRMQGRVGMILAQGFEKPALIAKRAGWSVMQLGKDVNDLLGISHFAKVKRSRPPVTTELSVVEAKQCSPARGRAATISSIPGVNERIPPSPPPSPPWQTAGKDNPPPSVAVATVRALFAV
eukprot:3800577-Prymnesium_polylepis.1